MKTGLIVRIGLETGLLPPWPHEALVLGAVGGPPRDIAYETTLSIMTDRKNAQRIARALRMGG